MIDVFEQFEQVRKREPVANLNGELIIACPNMKTNINVSMLVRSASCFGASRVIITGRNRVNDHISRDHNIEVRYHNSLLPVIMKYKRRGYKILGLEQTTNSQKIFDYQFSRNPTVLVIGNESKGIDPEILACLNEVIEIPLLNKPHSLNVAVATSIVLYEYAKQMSDQ